jgi:hypothetical protein
MEHASCPVTRPAAPPDTIAGAWEFVGFSQTGEAIDVVHLALVDFPPVT